MAIYVYITATGALVSYIPDSITVAQAQASGQLASNAVLASKSLTAVGGLPALGPTVAWQVSPPTTITIVPPPPAQPMPTYFFLMRFTPAEYAAISASTDPQVIQFWDAIRRTNVVDLSDLTIQAQGSYVSSLGLISAARGEIILTTPYVATSLTS